MSILSSLVIPAPVRIFGPWVLGLCVVGGSVLYFGHTRYLAGEVHIQTQWDADKALRQGVINRQLVENAKIKADRMKADQEAARKYAALQSDYDGLSRRLSDGLRDYAFAAATRSMSAQGSSPGLPADPGKGPGSPGEVTELVGLAQDAISACYADAAQLDALTARVEGKTAPAPPP